MKKTFAVISLAGALALAPLSTAHAAPEPAAPVAGCVDPTPGGCGWLYELVELFNTGSSSLSGS